MAAGRIRPAHVLLLVLAGVAAQAAIGGTASRNDARYYDDDPLLREPETQDASGAQEWEIDLIADLLINLFTPPPRVPPARAANVNTIDEVPDSSWFTNRIYARPLTVDDVVRGPNQTGEPAKGRWTVVRPKSAGMAPGFTARDSAGTVWFISFDPKGHPRTATGAIAVACRLFWALGYHQVESHLARISPEDIDIDAGATISPRPGRQRPMHRGDLLDVLDDAARDPDGSYRVLAARALPGRVIGGFRYHGTRPDDPNDVVPHEDRRELRALAVFGAWTNLVDMKAGNTLDTVVEQGGRHVVRHYLQDVGSTFGSGALGPREWDEGYEHLHEGDKAWKRAVTFGFYLQPWQTARYTKSKEVGRFQAESFDPDAWKPRVPVKAFHMVRDDDRFWAALRVQAFSDEMIRAAVAKAEYADPAAADLLAKVLSARRDRIAQAYLPRLNPLTRFAVTGTTLTFENAAVRAGVAAAPPKGYRAAWARYDNETGATQPIAETAGTGDSLPLPAGLPTADGAFVRAGITAVEAPIASWTAPVEVTLRRRDGGWKLVGVSRQP